MKRALVILGSIVAASAALATTYVRVEKDGTKTYSDRPIPGGHPIELQPAQTYSAPPTPSTPSRGPTEEQGVLAAANFQYEGCALSPRTDQTFQNPESVTLAVQLTPELRPGDQVIFSLDGSPVTASTPTSASLPFPERGSHTANVQVMDRYGKKVCDATTTFHVQRSGVNSPQRTRPGMQPLPPRPTPH